MNKKIITLAIGSLLLLAFFKPVNASVPRLVRYQGYVTDSNGIALLDGNYNLTFRIYDAPLGGNKLWEEAQAGVPVLKGNFSVLLGQLKPLEMTFEKDCWLSIQVSTDPEMSPRQRITSVPLAIRAERLDSAENMSPENRAKNGSFEAWTAGTSSAPDFWTLSGSGASVSSSTTKKLGAYALNQTSGSAESALTQAIPNPLDYANNKVTLSMWVKCAAANSARIFINDSTPIYSNYHTGSNQWELLSVTQSLTASPATLIIGTSVAANKNAQFDAAMLVQGPQAWAYSDYSPASLDELGNANKGDILYYDNGWKRLAKGSEESSLIIKNGLPVWAKPVARASDDTVTQSTGNDWQTKLTVTKTITPGNTALVIASCNGTGGSIFYGTGFRIVYDNNTVIQEISGLPSQNINLMGGVAGLSGEKTFKLQFKGNNTSISNAKLTVTEF